MELPSLDKISSIWAPAADELYEFCRQSPSVRLMNREFFMEAQRDEKMQIAKLQSSETSFEEVSIHTFLYMLLKKSNVYYTPDGRPSGIQFMEEEALLLCRMLKKEGFFEDVTDEPGCTVCATEKLEKNMMELMQRQLDVTRMAREYYTQPENAHKFNICANHLPFNPKDCVPNVNDVRGGPHHAPIATATYTGPQAMPKAQIVRQQQINPEVVPEYLRPRNANYESVPNYYAAQTLPADLIHSSNYYTLEYIANEMGVRPPNSAELPPLFGPQASPADLIPNSVPGHSLNSLFPNQVIDPACQLQFPTDSKFFPKDKNTRASTNNVATHVDSFETESINNVFVPKRPNAQTPTPRPRNVAMNSFQEAGPSHHIPNAENTMPQHFAGGANNILHRGLSMHQINNLVNQGLNPRTNPARRQLINNAVNNIAMDLQDEYIRGNRIGRKIVGKRY